MTRFLLAVLAILFLLAGQAWAQTNPTATQIPPGKTCFQATTGLSGSIQVLNNLTPGVGGTTGTYVLVPLTGGSGVNATATITVSGSGVATVNLLNPGTQYAVGDVLSANPSTIGGTTGFSVTVASTYIASNLAGGSVGMYFPGTLTWKQTWQDAFQTTLNTNPVTLDMNGCAVMFGTGAYRQIVLDSLGNKVWDQLTYTSPVNPFWAALATGTANVIVLNDAAFTAADGQSIQFVAAYANTGATTITIGGTTYPLYKNSGAGPVALTGGEIAANNVEAVTYSTLAGGFVLTSPTYVPTTISYAFGQVVFAGTSATTVAVTPEGGNLITIYGTNYAVPSAGVAANISSCYVNGVAGQTLSAATLYYVYLWNNAGVLSLNFSTTGHATDTTAGNVGVEIMASNSQYTLVGMVYPISGPNFAYSGANQLVASWFNRSAKTAQSNFTTTRTTTSSTPVEINSEIRTQVMVWSNSPSIDARINGAFSNGGPASTYIAIDGSTQPYAATGQSSDDLPLGMSAYVTGLAEGPHYVTLFGSTVSGTVTWLATTYMQATTND